MDSPCQRGNTLTEYCLIAASIAVVTIGSLSVFGNTVFRVYTGISHATLNSSQAGTGSGSATSNSMTLPASYATSMQRAADVRAGRMFNQLSKSAVWNGDPQPASLGGSPQDTGNSGNATSVDGNAAREAVSRNLQLIRRLQQIIQTSDNPGLKLWGTELLKRMQWLTASEGYAVGIPDFQNLIQNPLYSKSTAVNDMMIYQAEMTQILQGTAPDMWSPTIPSNIDPATWQKINRIVAQVSDNATALTVEMAPGTPASLTPWTGQYNALVANDTAIQNTIQQSLSSGHLANQTIVQDTAQKTIETQPLVNGSP